MRFAVMQGLILPGLACLLQAGCINIPPQVAAELEPSNGTPQNHFRRADDRDLSAPASRANGG